MEFTTDRVARDILDEGLVKKNFVSKSCRDIPGEKFTPPERRSSPSWKNATTEYECWKEYISLALQDRQVTA